MTQRERAFVIWTTVCLGIYLPTFCLIVYWALHTESNVNVGKYLLIPHLLSIVSAFGVVYVAIRDLYKRSFARSATRSLWLLVILGTGGWGAFVYAFVQGFRPRTHIESA